MIITIGWNTGQSAYLVIMKARNKDSVHMYTKNLIEIIHLIKLMKTHYKIQIAFHTSILPQVKDGILEGIRMYVDV